MQVGDHNGNLPPQLALIKLVLDQLKREALMEDTVDASTTTQLSSVDDRGATLNPPLKLIAKALNHTVGWAGKGGEGTNGRGEKVLEMRMVEERCGGGMMKHCTHDNKDHYMPQQRAVKTMLPAA